MTTNCEWCVNPNPGKRTLLTNPIGEAILCRDCIGIARSEGRYPR